MLNFIIVLIFELEGGRKPLLGGAAIDQARTAELYGGQGAIRDSPTHSALGKAHFLRK
jgi:hypothetical protein